MDGGRERERNGFEGRVCTLVLFISCAVGSSPEIAASCGAFSFSQVHMRVWA